MMRHVVSKVIFLNLILDFSQNNLNQQRKHASQRIVSRHNIFFAKI